MAPPRWHSVVKARRVRQTPRRPSTSSHDRAAANRSRLQGRRVVRVPPSATNLMQAVQRVPMDPCSTCSRERLRRRGSKAEQVYAQRFVILTFIEIRE